MSIYDNDARVGELTRFLVDSGARIFQIFQRGDEREHARFLLAEFSPKFGAMVLDVGCGVGEVALRMKEMRPDLEFILLNVSESQLALCPPEFDRIHAGVESIPLPDASVDAVMACYVLGHADKELALAEMRRVLKPGGVLFVADMTGGEIPELDYTAHDWDGVEPNGMNTIAFDKLMPEFAAQHPQIKPVIVREVRP